jgi:hypothetical protein
LKVTHPASGIAQLLHHHRIGARRHRRAGEDARRRAGGQRRADAAGGDALRHRQARAGHRHVGGTQRIAVHGRVVERRHSDAAACARASVRPVAHPTSVDLLDLRHRAGRGEELRQRFVEGTQQAHFRSSMLHDEFVTDRVDR